MSTPTRHNLFARATRSFVEAVHVFGLAVVEFIAAGSAWEPQRDQPVGLPPRKFSEAKALIRWVCGVEQTPRKSAIESRVRGNRYQPGR